jgi:hypothetical protein
MDVINFSGGGPQAGLDRHILIRRSRTSLARAWYLMA